jgi:hypothetical protein
VTSQSAFVDTEDGVIIVFQAPLGLHGHNRWRIVNDDQSGRLMVIEEANLQGPLLLMAFTVTTEQKAHGEQRRRYVEKAKELMETERK